MNPSTAQRGVSFPDPESWANIVRDCKLTDVQAKRVGDHAEGSSRLHRRLSLEITEPAESRCPGKAPEAVRESP